MIENSASNSSPRQDFLDVLQRVQRSKQFVADWKTNIERYRKLYSLNHYDRRIRKGETQYNDPTYTNTVDLAVGIMRSNDFIWHSFGAGVSKMEQRITGDIEKLLEGIITINTLRTEKDIRYEITFNFTRDGGSVLYSVFDPDLARNRSEIQIPDPESEGGTRTVWAYDEPPIRTQVIDPYKFIGLPGGPKRWLMMGRTERMSVLDVETLFGVRVSKYAGLSDELKAITKGEFMDVWDYVTQPDGTLGVRNTVIFEGESVRGPQLMPGYRDLPYTVQFFKPSGDESKDWTSLIAPLESTVGLLEKAFNRRAMQVDMYTGLPLVSKTQGGKVVQVDGNLFQNVQLNLDESLEFVQWPGNPPDVQNHMEFLRSRIQQSGFSDVMFGSGTGQIAGYALSQLGDQNRIRLTQPIKHMELMLTVWAQKTMQLLDYFARDTAICVYGHQEGRDYYDKVLVQDFKGYTVQAKIRPNFPNEKQRKVAMATQVKGILSEYTIMEQYLDIEQPEDEWERKLIEIASKDPVVMRYTLLNELKRRVDEEKDEIAAMVLQQLQNQNIPDGQPGRDGGPNPQQTTGLQSPNGQATPQAQGMEPAGQSAADQLKAAAGAAPGMMEG